MTFANQSAASAPVVNPFTPADVLAILSQCGWLTCEPAPEVEAWCDHAAAILGTQATDRAALSELLSLVFHFNAREILARVESHEVLARYGARDVVRRIALFLLDGTTLDSERFKEIIANLKQEMELRSRELFHPIRLALAGRSGGGELDRVILLLDEAAGLPFTVPVKSARIRILEFCAALD